MRKKIMTNVEVKILSGQRKALQKQLNTALQNGWHLMGPVAYAGNRQRGDGAYPASCEIVAFYTATVWKEKENTTKSNDLKNAVDDCRALINNLGESLYNKIPPCLTKDYMKGYEDGLSDAENELEEYLKARLKLRGELDE